VRRGVAWRSGWRQWSKLCFERHTYARAGTDDTGIEKSGRLRFVFFGVEHVCQVEGAVDTESEDKNQVDRRQPTVRFRDEGRVVAKTPAVFLS
jgi:hypothetical protein